MKCLQSPPKFLMNSIKQKLNRSSFGKDFGAALFRNLKAGGFSYAVCGSVVPRATAYTASRSVREFSLKFSSREISKPWVFFQSKK